MSSSASDPATALRQAALSTLKSRRNPKTPLNPRPVVHDTSVQLDYGQAVELPTPAFPAVFPSAPTQDHSDHPDPPDGPAREEGEISDSESAPIVPVTVTAAHKPPLLEPKTSTADGPCQPQPSITMSVLQNETRENVSQPSMSPPGTRPSDCPTTESTRIIVDADHVRPGLAMTLQEYNQAKDIILDLLGWGVDPEYLVQCNLSREIIYYAFHELNLKLPNNLDITGIIPYPPSPDLLSLASPPVQTSGVLVPPTASSYSSVRTDSESTSSDLAGKPLLHHGTLPVKPPKFARTKLTQGASRPRSVSPSSTATSLSPPSSASPVIPHPSLHDIERQRRQELLARKAVQATRPPKLQQWESVSSISATECKDQDMEQSAEIPQVSVDDFLNSIGPGLPITHKAPNHHSYDAHVTNMQHPESGTSAMDVDVPMPKSVAPPLRGMTPPHSPLSVQSSSASVCSYSTSPTPELSRATPSVPPLPPSFLSLDEPSIAKPDVNEKSFDSRGDNNGASSRRGLKRPVAADFVDIDYGPSPAHVGNGHVNGQSSQKKAGRFASISGVRRCVIDLSDSEDEGSMSGSRLYLGNGGIVRESPHIGSTTPSLPAQSRAQSGRATPITPSLTGPPGSLSPAALLEKEEEIRQMRELIAQRERNRLKKLALSSRSSRNATQSTKMEVEDDETIHSSSTPVTDGTDPRSVESRDVIMQGPISPGLPTTQISAVDQTRPLIDDPNANSAHILPGVAGREDNAVTTRLQVAGYPGSPNSGNSPEQWMSPPQEITNSQLPIYDSLFERYPLLRSHSRPVFSGTAATIEPVTGVLLPSLRALKFAAIADRLDPSKRICQYEVPGGGVCRDVDCEDAHLDYVVIEPGDDVSAQYVHDGLPEEWRRRFNVQQIKQALMNVRERNTKEDKTAIDLEARVAEALVALSGHTGTKTARL